MIRFTSIVLNSDGSWTFDWTPTGAPSYRVILDGDLIDTPDAPPYNFRIDGFSDEPPHIEVVEAGELADSEKYPPHETIQWWPVHGADHYRVEKKVGADWVPFKTVVESGAAVHSITVPLPADESPVEIRVSAIDVVGQASGYLHFKVRGAFPPEIKESDTRVGYDKAAGEVFAALS
jgi:hypothetical protein